MARLRGGIIACDLAEVSARDRAETSVRHSLIGGALLAALDAFLLLLLMTGFRFLEAFVIALLIVIFVCFASRSYAAPPVAAMLRGFVLWRDRYQSGNALHRDRHHRCHRDAAYLYLHSSIVQTRAYQRTDEGRRDAIKWATTDPPSR